MPAEAQPVEITSVTVPTRVGHTRGSGFIKMARKILQTQLKQEYKIKSNNAKSRFGLSRNMDVAFK